MVSLKLLHYGNERNYILLPGQSLDVERFSKNNLKTIYSYLKALKTLLDVPVKSFENYDFLCFIT
jgi:hypothetical protein